VKMVERRVIVMAAARDINIVVHTIPDKRPSSSVIKQTLKYHITNS